MPFVVIRDTPPAIAVSPKKSRSVISAFFTKEIILLLVSGWLEMSVFTRRLHQITLVLLALFLPEQKFLWQ